MRFRHSERGTEVEADQESADALAADGYKAVAEDGEQKTSGRTRKKDE